MRSCTPKLNCSFLYSKDGQNSKFKKVETPRKIMEPEYPWNMHFRNVFFPDSNEFCLHTHSRTQKADWRTSKKQYTLPTSLHGMGYNFPWPKCAEENLEQKQMINMGKTNIIRLGHLFYFFLYKGNDNLVYLLVKSSDNSTPPPFNLLPAPLNLSLARSTKISNFFFFLR